MGAVLAGSASIGIDFIGLIPEAGGVARVIGQQAGYRGAVADQLGNRVVKAVGGSTGVFSLASGLGDTSPLGVFSTSLGVAGFVPGFVPVAQQAISILSIMADTYRTAQAIGQCP